MDLIAGIPHIFRSFLHYFFTRRTARKAFWTEVIILENAILGPDKNIILVILEKRVSGIPDLEIKKFSRPQNISREFSREIIQSLGPNGAKKLPKIRIFLSKFRLPQELPMGPKFLGVRRHVLHPVRWNKSIVFFTSNF